MTTAKMLLDRLSAFSMLNEVHKIIDSNTQNLVILNIQQLMAGKNRLGDYLTPKITDDPFFKTRKQAEAYAAWKKRMYPFTPYNQPNLRINGYLHSTIDAIRVGNVISFDAMAGFTPAIDAKYNNTAFGLSPVHKELIRQHLIIPELRQQLHIKVGITSKRGPGAPTGWITLIEKPI